MIINTIDDLNNLTDGDLRDIYDKFNFDTQDEEISCKEKDNFFCCPICSCLKIHEEDNMVTCTECGTVIKTNFDLNPEWKQGEDGDRNEGRCSMPINQLLPISSLGTRIGGNCRGRIQLIQSWDYMPYREISLNKVFKRIQYLCDKGKILKCIEDDAKIMYKNISDGINGITMGKKKHVIIRGKNREGLILACVFFSCRKNKKTLAPKELAVLSGLKYTEITHGCKTFMKLLSLINNTMFSHGTTKPEHFVGRFCLDLKLTKDHSEKALQIAKNIKKLNIASAHSPYSIATCCILLMAIICGLQSITKKVISLKFNVSEVILTKTFGKIEIYKNIVINDEITNELVKSLTKTREKTSVPDFVTERLKKFQNIDIEDVDSSTNCDENECFIYDDLEFNVLSNKINDAYDVDININEIKKLLLKNYHKYDDNTIMTSIVGSIYEFDERLSLKIRLTEEMFDNLVINNISDY